MQFSELLESVAGGRTEFDHVEFEGRFDLSEAVEAHDLVGLSFRHAIFSHVIFIEVTFRDCDFTLAEFSRSVIHCSAFFNCIFRGATFEFVDTDMFAAEDCDFHSVSFDMSKFCSSGLVRCDLDDIRGVVMFHYAHFTDCELDDLAGAVCDFFGARFDSCMLDPDSHDLVSEIIRAGLPDDLASRTFAAQIKYLWHLCWDDFDLIVPAGLRSKVFLALSPYPNLRRAAHKYLTADDKRHVPSFDDDADDD